MFKKFLCGAVVLASLVLTSCGGEKSLIVPHSVSSSEVVTPEGLNLQKGQYDIMKSVTETASVTVKYGNSSIKVMSGDGEFSYTFEQDKKKGWVLKSFSGAANFGYLGNVTKSSDAALLGGEEFARRVAIARLINDIKDYGADGALEPIVITRASNAGKNTVEYQATVTAKIVKIHTTSK